MPHTHCCRCRVAFVEGEKTLLVSEKHGSYCEGCQRLLRIGIAAPETTYYGGVR